MQGKRRVIIEAAVASPEDARRAVAAGADRIELSQALELGGLTPSIASIEATRRIVSCELWVLIRPRAAGFRYDDGERPLMIADAVAALKAGADGVVCGVLTSDDRIDLETWRRLTEAIGGRRCAFHRAIDRCADPITALESLVACGTRRVLSSGGAVSAWEGRARLSDLVRAAADRIEILPGAGIDSDNARPLLKATGCVQLHGTFSRRAVDPAAPVGADDYPVLDVERLERVRAAVDRPIGDAC